MSSTQRNTRIKARFAKERLRKEIEPNEKKITVGVAKPFVVAVIFSGHSSSKDLELVFVSCQPFQRGVS